MNREEALKKSEEALHELAAALRQGKSESLVQYLDVMSQFHQYSFGNCMLIYCKCRPLLWWPDFIGGKNSIAGSRKGRRGSPFWPP